MREYSTSFAGSGTDCSKMTVSSFNFQISARVYSIAWTVQ